MKIVCPYCNEEIEVDFEKDIEATLWNFDGERGDIEITPYCENCKHDIIVSLKTKIDVIGFTTYKRG